MNMNSVHISVVIPLYNKRAYIRRAVGSVLTQSFSDFELIVIDDGSTDGSHEMLADVSDPRLKLIRQQNAGEGAARNSGIAAAAADWVALLDADDMWLEDHLQELWSLIARFPDSGLVATGSREVAEGAAWERPIIAPSNIRQVDYFIEAARRIGVINSSCAAVHRALTQSLGGFGPFRAGADLECWAKLALRGPVAISDRVTSIYFRGTGGVMDTMATAGKTRVLPARLEDISASVALLTRALRDGGYAAKKASIEAYINSRLLRTVVGGFYLRDLALSRAAANLSIGCPTLYFRALKYFLILPDAVVLPAISAFSAARAQARALVKKARHQLQG